MTDSGRLPPRHVTNRARAIRFVLLLPAVLGFAAMWALLPIVATIFSGSAREALAAVIIGGILALLANLVVQYVGRVIDQLQKDDRLYRSEVALLMPLLMELGDAAAIFRADVSGGAF